MELVVVVAVAAMAAAMASAIAAARPGPTGPVESDAAERHLVRWVRSHPWLHRVVRMDMTTGAVGSTVLVAGFVLAALVAATLGLLLRAADDRDGTFAAWDERLSTWGVPHADSVAVDVLRYLTELGGTPVVVSVAVLVALVDYARHRSATGPAFLALVVVGQNVLVNAIKVVVDRPRPDVLQLVSAHGPSFPSGHSTAGAACWAAFALVLSRRSSRLVRSAAAGGAALVAVAVAASRALLGVHWATDVIGGVVLGWAWFTFVALAFGGRLQRFGEPGERLGARAAHPPGALRPGR